MTAFPSGATTVSQRVNSKLANERQESRQGEIGKHARLSLVSGKVLLFR